MNLTLIGQLLAFIIFFGAYFWLSLSIGKLASRLAYVEESRKVIVKWSTTLLTLILFPAGLLIVALLAGLGKER